MKYQLSIFALALLMCGCANNSVKPENKLAANAQFLQPAITLNLKQALVVEGYPDQAELAKLLQEKTTEAFKSRNLIADKSNSSALSVNIAVDYRRQFAGEATPIKTKSVGIPIVHYRITVSDSGVEKRIIDKDGMTVNRGFGSNLASGLTLWLGNTAKDELKDLELLASAFASEVEALKER